MSKTLQQEVKEFLAGSAIAARREQIDRFRPIAREILHELVNKERITDEDLTGLIHLFRPNPVPHELALRYLNHIIPEPSRAKDIADRLVATGLGGFTAPGRLRIHSHTADELRVVQDLIRTAFTVRTSTEAARLCKDYEAKEIRYVTAGIYSPWLHYINPELFPILNGATRSFFRAQGLPIAYPDLVAQVPTLSGQLGVKDFGVLDFFVWHQENGGQQEDPKDGAWRKAKWIKRISRGDWEHFLDACSTLVDVLDLGPDDPRLAMNIRTDDARRLSVNLLNRLVLGLENKSKTEALLILPRDFHTAHPHLGLSGEDPFSTEPPAALYHIAYPAFRNQDTDLIDQVTAQCRAFLPRGESSTYRVHHIPDLYRMVTDTDFREKALDHLLEGKGEWPGSVSQAREISYWIFQSNPKWYDAKGALRDNAVDRWSIDVHKQRIKPGDKAIIWVTGPEGGCCALATVASIVQPMDIDTPAYARSPDFVGVHDRVRITIDHNLWDHPISKAEAREHLPDLKAGNQGTTFSATKEQYEFFLQRATATKQRAMHDLNTILYGPPGTGKTHHAVTYAVAIIENRPFEDVQREAEAEGGRAKVRERYERYCVNGQVKATTFHQSFSYEDFVEGIKPLLGGGEGRDVQYEIKDGVFKAMCTSARSALKLRTASGHGHPIIPADVLDLASFWKASIGYYTDPEDDAIYEYCMANDVFAMGWGGSTDLANAGTVEDIADRLKADGVSTEGRVLTFTRYLRLEMEEGDVVFVSEGNDTVRSIGIVIGPYFMDASAPIRYKQFRKVKWLYKDLQLPVSDFYGNSFTQGTLWYLKQHLIKREFFQPPANASGNDDQRYVLIIDEINRGNIAGIFGELITLIEKDKREGCAEAFPVKLPYSKTEDFLVPSNLYILGTMNTADRSVEALDTALRRRFSFVEMPSRPDKIEQPADLVVDLRALLTAINGRIERLLDRDHHIGHSYFMGVRTENDLRMVFKNKVLPLLQEYFYGDPRKLGAVLGEPWVTLDKKNGYALRKGFDVEDAEKPSYTIADPMDEEKVPASAFNGLYA